MGMRRKAIMYSSAAEQRVPVEQLRAKIRSLRAGF
jgi:hypothetical protein